jgi:hypothetical protein
MLAINLFLSLLIALPLWYLGSRGLAEIIYRTETHRPQIAASAAWSAVETASNLLVFAGSVALWFGMTYLLQQFNH